MWLRSELKTAGIFEYVRHPIYGGGLLLCFGFSIISNSLGCSKPAMSGSQVQPA